jgi:hypothetical protein
MSKQKNKRVNVKAKHVEFRKDQAVWIYKGLPQRTLSHAELHRLANGETLSLMTLNAPKHTAVTIERKRAKKT